LSNGGCSGGVYLAIWDYCETELNIDIRFNAPQIEDILDCALIGKEMATELLEQLKKSDLFALAHQIAPDWDLPADMVQRGMETFLSHLEQAQGGASLMYEMV